MNTVHNARSATAVASHTDGIKGIGGKGLIRVDEGYNHHQQQHDDDETRDCQDVHMGSGPSPEQREGDILPTLPIIHMNSGGGRDAPPPPPLSTTKRDFHRQDTAMHSNLTFFEDHLGGGNANTNTNTPSHLRQRPLHQSPRHAAGGGMNIEKMGMTDLYNPSWDIVNQDSFGFNLLGNEGSLSFEAPDSSDHKDSIGNQQDLPSAVTLSLDHDQHQHPQHLTYNMNNLNMSNIMNLGSEYHESGSRVGGPSNFHHQEYLMDPTARDQLEHSFNVPFGEMSEPTSVAANINKANNTKKTKNPRRRPYKKRKPAMQEPLDAEGRESPPPLPTIESAPTCMDSPVIHGYGVIETSRSASPSVRHGQRKAPKLPPPPLPPIMFGGGPGVLPSPAANSMASWDNKMSFLPPLPPYHSGGYGPPQEVFMPDYMGSDGNSPPPPAFSYPPPPPPEARKPKATAKGGDESAEAAPPSAEHGHNTRKKKEKKGRGRPPKNGKPKKPKQPRSRSPSTGVARGRQPVNIPKLANPTNGETGMALLTLPDGQIMTSDKAPGIGWSGDEDLCLLEIMANTKSAISKWDEVSKEHNSGRSARECHDRWTRYLKPGSRKGQWSEQEDAIVLRVIFATGGLGISSANEMSGKNKDGSSKDKKTRGRILVNSSGTHFTQWADLSPQLPGRTGKQIRDRWVNYLNPAINHMPFTCHDDMMLWNGHSRYGKRWVEISTKVFHSTRSENHIKNRWYSAAFKKFVYIEFGKETYENAKTSETKLVSKDVNQVHGRISKREYQSNTRVTREQEAV